MKIGYQGRMTAIWDEILTLGISSLKIWDELHLVFAGV